MPNPYATRTYLGKSREEVVIEYAPLVRQIANRLGARLPEHLSRDDLVQAGMLGLLDAMDKYDSGKEAQFRTYAEFRIKGAMLDDLRASDWVPRSVRDNAHKIGSAQQAISATEGRPAEEAEIAEKLGLSLAEYHALLLKSRAINLLSLEDLAYSDGEGDAAHILEVLKDPYCSDPLEALSLQHMKLCVIEAIEQLPEKERLVLSLYFDEDLNLKEIGEVLNITESRISQIRTQAILRLRNALQDLAKPGQLEELLAKRAG